MNEFKLSVLSLALMGGTLYALAAAVGIDMSIADIAVQVVQRGAELLHRLLL